MSNLLPSSSKSLFNKPSSKKTSFQPNIHIVTDLPCPSDEDLDEIPHPCYNAQDIVRVQSVLLNFVPVELADAIIDLAEYWSYVAVSRNSFTSAYSALEAPDHNAQWCYLVSPKIPSIERGGVCVPTEVKMVKFFIKTYESCYGKRKELIGSDIASWQGYYRTWFEAWILKDGQCRPSYDINVRPNHWYANMAVPYPIYLNGFREIGEPVANPFDEQTRWHVATNPQFSSDEGWHEITWRHDDSSTTGTDSDQTGRGAGFLGSLSVNDQVVLMARAMYPGWISAVFNVKIEIYYAFSSSYL